MNHSFTHQKLVEGDYKLNQIQVGEELGCGNSHVHAVNIAGSRYAMKQLQIATDYEYHNFLKEISMLKTLSASNPALIKYEGYFVTVAKEEIFSATKKFAYIIMEYAEMNLSDLIGLRLGAHSYRFSVSEIQNIALILLKGFADLEKKNVAHCDIKPENILVIEQNPIQLKICDVGSSKFADTSTFDEATIKGTLPFMAPEIIDKKKDNNISLNPFRSDVFSFGLLILFLTTGKKFSSKERLEVSGQVYRQIIGQWFKEANQIYESDILSAILKECLSFDHHQRSLFKELKFLCEGFWRKKKILEINSKSRLKENNENTNRYELQNDKVEVEKMSKISTTVDNQKSVSNFNYNFNTRKRLTSKLSIGLNKKNSQQKEKKKRKYSNETKKISPSQTVRSQKMKTSLSSDFSIDRSKVSHVQMNQKIFYVDRESHQLIPYEIIDEREKNFVLMDQFVGFHYAKAVTVLASCPIRVLYKLAETKGNAFYLQFKDYEGLSVDENAPMLEYEKIYINLERSVLSGGYNNLLRSLCPISLKRLHLRLTGSDIKFKDVSMELQRLKSRQIKILKISWDNNFMQANQHQELLQKISKLSTLKELQISQSSNFIQYETEARWKLPPNLKTLSMNYENNFLNPILGSLGSSFKDLCELRQLNINFSNNNFQDSDIKVLLKSLIEIKNLDKLSLNFSLNLMGRGIYALQDLIQLKSLRSLQVKIHKCGIEEKKVLGLIAKLVTLLNEKLKLLKIYYDRVCPKCELENQLEAILSGSNIKSVILPYDYKYFMICFEKGPKKEKTQTNNLIRIRTKKEPASKKTIIYGFHQKQKQKQKINQLQEKKLEDEFPCSSLFTSEPEQVYVCITCSALKQKYKSEFFCQKCATHCQHQERSKHRVIKISQPMQCSCAYNGCIVSQDSISICAQILKVPFKKEYCCQKCKMSFCKNCASICMKSHHQEVEIRDHSFFKCKGLALVGNKQSCHSALLPH